MTRKFLFVAISLALFFGLAFIYISTIYFQTNLGKVSVTDYRLLDDKKTIVYKVERSDKLTETIRSFFGYKNVTETAKTGGGIIVTESKRLKNRYLVNPEKRFGEYWFLTVYQLDNEKLISKDIDLFDVVLQYYPDSILNSVDSWITLYKGQHYIKLELSTPKQVNKNVYLNLDQEGIEEISEEMESFQMAKKQSFPFLFMYATSIKENLKQVSRTDLALEVLPKDVSNILLQQKDSEAYSLIKQKGSYLSMLGSPTLEESVHALQLLLPEGTNIFDNVTIPADYSIDGQEHVVNSFEEFQQCYKVH